MSDGIVYTTVSRYVTEGLAEAGRTAASAEHHFDGLGHSMERAESMMDRLNKTALSYLGWRQLWQDAKQAAAGFIEVSNAAEQAQFTIAALVQAGGVSGTDSWAGAMRVGSEYIAQMRRDAQALPGTFQDLMNIVQPAMLPGLEAGLSLKQIEKLSADMMAVGKLMQINPVVVGHEMEMLLHGRATSRTPLFAKLSGAIGMTAKEFNALDQDQRIAKLNEAVSRFDDAIKAYDKTWDAVSSTLEDNITEFHRLAGATFFGAVKEQVKELNDYYTQHKEQITGIASAVGRDLAGGFAQVAHYVKDGFGWLENHKDSLLQIAKVYGAVLVGSKVGGFFGGAGSDSRFGAAGGSASVAAQAMLAGTLRESVRTGFVAAVGTPGNFLGNAGHVVLAREAALAERERLGGINSLRMAFGNGTPTALPSRFFGNEFSEYQGTFMRSGMAGMRSLGRSEFQAIGNYGMPSVGQVAGNVAMNYAMAHLLNNMNDMSRGFRVANDAIVVATSSLGSLPGPIGQIASGLGIFYQALNALAGWIDSYMKDQNESIVAKDMWERRSMFAQAGVDQLEGQRAVMQSMMEQGALQDAEQKRLHDWAAQVVSMAAPLAASVRSVGGFDANGNVSLQAIQLGMGRAGVGDAMKVQDVARVADVYKFARSIVDNDETLRKAKDEGKGKEHKLHKPNPVVNIYQNNHIYEADDPDRVRVVIRESLEDALYRPTHSAYGPASVARY